MHGLTNPKFTYLLHGAESFLRTNRFSESQEILRIIWNTKVHYSIHKCPPPVPLMSQIDPVYALTTYCLKIRLNIILSSLNKQAMKSKDL